MGGGSSDAWAAPAPAGSVGAAWSASGAGAAAWSEPAAAAWSGGNAQPSWGQTGGKSQPSWSKELRLPHKTAGDKVAVQMLAGEQNQQARGLLRTLKTSGAQACKELQQEEKLINLGPQVVVKLLPDGKEVARLPPQAGERAAKQLLAKEVKRQLRRPGQEFLLTCG